jgi:hypothetical protein
MASFTADITGIVIEDRPKALEIAPALRLI